MKVVEEGEKYTIYIYIYIKREQICLSMKVIIRDFSLGSSRLGKKFAHVEYVP